MRLAVLLSLMIVASDTNASTAQGVSARQEEDRIIVEVNGGTFTEYLFSREHKYPFFYPVNGPASGRSVTTWDQQPYPHHSSLYISLDHVRSENVRHGNYWQPRNRLETGQIFSRDPQIVEDDGNKVVLRDVADWIVPATGSHQLRDTRTVTIRAPSPSVRIMDFTFDFEAMKDIEVGQTGHSFFSARMRPEIAVGCSNHGREWADMGTGTIVSSEGTRNEEGTRERAADWLAYYGSNNGETEGLAIIQHSSNPMYPAKWFTRNYGFMSPTPFAFDGDRRFRAGETMTFRYRVVVFSGDHEAADIAGWHDDFEASAIETAGVKFKHDEDGGKIEVHVRGEHFTTFHYGEKARTPFLWPVLAEGGVGITRNYPMGRDEPSVRDHPHHRSLWLIYGNVNGHDFWHGRGGEKVETRDIEKGFAEGFAWLRAHNAWIGRGNEPQVDEVLELRFHDSPASERFIDFIVTFIASYGDVTFADDKEGLMALRIRPEIDGRRDGVLTNARGEQGERNVYGTPAAWMDYSGHIQGHGNRGIAVFDHPENFRAGYWHVRDYGLAAVNPFAPKEVGGERDDGSYTIKEGESLTLRYRVYVHSGNAGEADIAGHYERYISDRAVIAPVPTD